MATKNVPKLRFKGFTEEWEKKVLGEFGYVAMNKRIYKNQTAPVGEVPFYKIGTFGGTPDSYISRELFNEFKQKYPYPEVGDILISASGSIGRLVEYKGADEYFQDSNIIWLAHDERLSNIFLKQLFTFIKWSGLEGSTIKRLYNKNVLETVFMLPNTKHPTKSIAEQKQIGKFFQNIDKLINANQNKLDKLKNIKKACLEKMFPRRGATTPEIRFKGFSGEWEEKKLGNNDVTTSYSGGTPLVGVKEYYDGTIPFIRSGEINSNYTELFITEKGLDNSSAKRVYIGDILYALYGATSGEVGISMINGAINQAIMAIKPQKKYDSRFITYWLRKEKNNIINTYLQGGQGNLSSAIVKGLNIAFPTEKEQILIGTFFQNLDNLISKNEQQLAKLKNIKKACLEKMFVNKEDAI